MNEIVKIEIYEAPQVEVLDIAVEKGFHICPAIGAKWTF